MSGDKIDPGLYRQLSEPFESPEAANNALDGFWEEVYALRNKYKIPNLYCIFHINVKHLDERIPGALELVEDNKDAEGSMFGRLSAGDPLMTEAMTGWAFGQEQAARQERVSRVVNDALKKALTLKSRKN